MATLYLTERGATVTKTDGRLPRSSYSCATGRSWLGGDGNRSVAAAE